MELIASFAPDAPKVLTAGLPTEAPEESLACTLRV